MINSIHRTLHRPEKGWDPVKRSYAAAYAIKVSESDIEEVFAYLQRFVGKVDNKMRILDLGGGPGHFSVAFAKIGAAVLWYDISHNYQRMAQERAALECVSITFKIGYMEEVPKSLNESFDLVFNRVCWYYGASDRAMMRVVKRLVKPGGYVYIETNNSKGRKKGVKSILQYLLNDCLYWKIGHPYPPEGRVEKLLRKGGFTIVDSDYSREGFDRVLGKKEKRRFSA